MMNMQAESYADSFSHAFFGFLITVALILFGLMTLRFPGVTLSFIWVPLMGVYLWPRFATPLASVFFVFAAGLIQDILNGQPAGFSSVMFLMIFVIFRPKLDFDRLGMTALWLRFGGVMIVSILAFFILRLLGSGVSVINAIMDGIIAFVLFPIFVGLRTVLRNIFIPNERL